METGTSRKPKKYKSRVPRLIRSKSEPSQDYEKNYETDFNESEAHYDHYTEDESQEYDHEEEDDDKEETSRIKTFGLGLCSACHLTVDSKMGRSKSSPCHGDHLVCQRCVKHCSEPDENCLLCDSSASSNQAYEDSYDLMNLNLDSPESQEITSDVFQKSPQDLELSYTSLTSLEIRTSLTSRNECSRRPIRCPRLDCAINIAFSSLINHFLFDHPEVPILSVEPGVKSTLVFNKSTFFQDSNLCLAILLISGKLTDQVARLFNGSQLHPKYRNRLPLPVLATRLRSSSADPLNYEMEVIVLWIASLDVATIGTICYSIEVVDDLNDCIRSLRYTGPVNSLRIAQRPREVLRNGDCLVVHRELINQLTAAGNLNINVVVN
ncbi:hypothetical protein KQX54_013459 [Cotesia glomerata]|uniref:DUF4729 domain-containing protein n=2 Tax=Cotesia glomerata TaxID=32391 RepID=A0AAV7IHV6_COTGL|nr:hypothetical protein KQX54_013459 [Cotesia glomerata]